MLLGLALAACTPALDWRESRPTGSGMVVLFPCKPDSHARQVQLGPDAVRLELHACTAAGATWALAFADMGDPARVGPALVELRTSAAKNLANQLRLPEISRLLQMSLAEEQNSDMLLDQIQRPLTSVLGRPSAIM